jgi:signal transduction histidine kinase
MMRNTIEILQQINIFMESIDNLHRMLLQIMKVSMEAVSAQASSVFLYKPDTHELNFDVVLGDKCYWLTERSVRLGEGIVGCAAQNLEVINISDVSRDSRFNDTWDKMTGFTTRSILAVPMIRRGELVGVLEVINKLDADGFDREDQELIRIIASQAAIAVENAKLYQVVLDKNRLLEQALAELKETQTKLIQAEKMSAIGNMSAQIMHDIRNPMSIIRMCCEVLSTPRMRNADIPDLVNIIRDQVDRTGNMIRDFLDFARGETHLALKEMPVEELLGEITEFQQRDCTEKGITFLTRLDYTGQIKIDADKINRVLSNIINNAKEAVMEKKDEQQGVINLSVSARNGFVDFLVTDNGPGIPREIRTKLFQPFVTKGKKEGTGLGLAIVDKIVRDHGGTIFVETSSDTETGELKAGTTFMVSIPHIR